MRIVLEFNYEPEDLSDMGKLWWKARKSDPIHRRLRQLIVVVAFAIVIALLLILVRKQLPAPTATPASVTAWPLPPPPPPPGSATQNLLADVVLPLLPWLLVIAFFVFFFIRNIRGLGRRAYEANNLLQLRHTMIIDDVDGISESTAVTSSSWRWPALTAVFEQPNAFALRVSESQSFVIIPKRAVPPEQMDALRAMLNEHVHPSTGAFPVVPIELPQRSTPPNSTPPPLQPVQQQET